MHNAQLLMVYININFVKVSWGLDITSVQKVIKFPPKNYLASFFPCLSEQILEAQSLRMLYLLLIAQSDGVFNLLLLCHLLEMVVSAALGEVTSGPH